MKKRCLLIALSVLFCLNVGLLPAMANDLDLDVSLGVGDLIDDPEEPDGPLPYDLNKDGSVDVNDTLLLIRYVIGEHTADDPTPFDINGDGIADVLDAIALLKHIFDPGL
ncbi:MAG: hypothetical protein E7655_04360 [Ruminococcaceae bacterium]|nr:hypothetical protein [Oscillospiraceae bacterium]